ncbi:MAG TPA: universal stress protein [Actinomycetota bacterium]|nr:universal stress protein [Actinomycetota bacterium]
MGRILVGTDTSPSADLAVRAAADLARHTHAELLVLYVRSDGGLRDAADPRKRPDPGRYMADLSARFPELRVRSWVEPGEPAERLCEVAVDEGVDTIVVGNKGAGGSRWRVRESVPTMVVRHAPCSVLIVDTRVAQ